MLWFHKDNDGGYVRLVTRLGLNNLDFRGNKVPTSRKAVVQAVQELANAVISEGAVGYVAPTKPLSFSRLVQDLEVRGLLEPIVVVPLPDPPAQEAPLRAAHHLEVVFYSLEIQS